MIRKTNEKNPNIITIKYYFIICVYTVIDFLFGPGYTTFMQKQGLTIEQIGIVLAVWSIFSFVLEIPSGSFADKYGRKRMMIYGFAIWGTGLLLYAFASSVFLFILSFLFIALGMSLISGTPEAWYISNSLADNSYIPNALSTSQAISLFLSVITGIIFSFITMDGKENLPYILAGGISLLFCITLGNTYQEYSLQRDLKSRKLLYYVTTSWNKLWRSPILRIYLLKIFLISLASQIFILGWQLYVINTYTIKNSLLGILLSFLTGMLAIGFAVSSVLYKHVNGVLISCIGNCILVVGLSMICAADELGIFLLGGAMLEIGLGIEKGASVIWVQKEIDEEIRSTALSFFEVFRVIAAFAASLCISFIVPRVTFRRIWYVSLIASILSCFVLGKLYQMKYRSFSK